MFEQACLYVWAGLSLAVCCSTVVSLFFFSSSFFFYVGIISFCLSQYVNNWYCLLTHRTVISDYIYLFCSNFRTMTSLSILSGTVYVFVYAHENVCAYVCMCVCACICVRVCVRVCVREREGGGEGGGGGPIFCFLLETSWETSHEVPLLFGCWWNITHQQIWDGQKANQVCCCLLIA